VSHFSLELLFETLFDLIHILCIKLETHTEKHVGLYFKTSFLSYLAVTKTGIYRQILVVIPTIKFHEICLVVLKFLHVYRQMDRYGEVCSHIF
jgi:hypothetical protein